MRTTLSKLILSLCALSLFAGAHELEQQRGLKRFDKAAELGSRSDLQIKDVYIGDNALASSISLSGIGGEIHNITGGTRSNKVRFSFFQPYQGSRLEELIELNFNKENGFIEKISSTYKIKSAYLDISPIREKVLQAAIEKYGEPLSMAEIYGISSQQKGEVKLKRFMHEIVVPDTQREQVLGYFAKRNISKTAKFSEADKGRAIMHTGFDLCYLWHRNNFAEILSFCSFAPKAANASNRGVELGLENFDVQQQIAKRKSSDKQQDSLSISL
jgi:hypothetical protein